MTHLCDHKTLPKFEQPPQFNTGTDRVLKILSNTLPRSAQWYHKGRGFKYCIPKIFSLNFL